ncbi:MAG: GGDEF domain-containing protein [Lachnospiraceae bacterium]|nr:GGDEF domain-containing protein [Lachnospiraceae bacterium]
MEKHIKKLYSILLIIAILLAIFIGSIREEQYNNRSSNTQITKWEVSPEWRDTDYEISLPLPTDKLSGKFIAFQSAHFEIDVLIDNETVFTLHAANPKINKSTGYRWNFIKLRDEDAGKTMTLHWIPSYKNISPKKTIYLGDEVNIRTDIFKSNGLRFILSIFILIIGIELFIYAVVIVGKNDKDSALFHFSFFSILLACWSILESPVCNLITPFPVGSMILDHYVLMIMPMPFVMYTRCMFSNKRNPLWNIYLYINSGIILIRTFLQITCLFDIKQTLWMTHLSILLFITIGAVLGVKEFKVSKMTRQMRINILCILVILAATAFELIMFQIFHKSSIYGMLGYVCYIVVMSVEMVNKSRKTIARAQEAELYQKLAYTDELTGVYNRTAFRHDFNSLMPINRETGERTIEPNTIFIFDLNDLKHCNDTYGHENGDKYIQMISNALVQVFGIDGRCYRIGGDEFCVIMPSVKKNEIENKLHSLNLTLQELDRNGFVVPVSTAAGYAIYDKELDQSLNDTMRRADAQMYQNKETYKKSHAVNKAAT